MLKQAYVIALLLGTMSIRAQDDLDVPDVPDVVDDTPAEDLNQPETDPGAGEDDTAPPVVNDPPSDDPSETDPPVVDPPAPAGPLSCQEGGVCKFGVFSDFHLMDDYGPKAGNDLYCVQPAEGSGKPEAEIAPLGRLGCDGPAELATAMMEMFVEENKDAKPDFILLTGDIVRHQVSLKPYYNYFQNQCVRGDQAEATEGKDWKSAGTVKRGKDCKHICGDDGECSGYDFDGKTKECRLWYGDIIEHQLNDERHMECAVKNYKPRDDAPQKEKDVQAKRLAAHYPRLKAIHTQLQQLFTKNFPDTPVLMTFGNNDCRYHYSGPFAEEKEEFYQFVHKTWFEDHTPNQGLKNVDEIKKSFMNGGYYEANINDKLSVLALNTLYWNGKQARGEGVTEAQEQFAWLEERMKEDSDRKYIFIDHIYAGARMEQDKSFSTEPTWKDDWQNKFFDLVRDHSEKLSIEVAGHDHWEDLRSYQDPATGKVYRNLLVATGVGLDHWQLPGFNTFVVDENGIPKNLIETSLDITKAYGQENPDWRTLPKHQLNFAEQYGFKDLTAAEIDSSLDAIYQDGDVTDELQYMSDKLGYDHNDPEQFKTGQKRARDWSLINDEHTRTLYFYCQNTEGRSEAKLRECIKRLSKEKLTMLAAFFQVPKGRMAAQKVLEQVEEIKFLSI